MLSRLERAENDQRDMMSSSRLRIIEKQTDAKTVRSLCRDGQQDAWGMGIWA
jgi:uncharacterized membrane-anchored protein